MDMTRTGLSYMSARVSLNLRRSDAASVHCRGPHGQDRSSLAQTTQHCPDHGRDGVQVDEHRRFWLERMEAGGSTRQDYRT